MGAGNDRGRRVSAAGAGGAARAAATPTGVPGLDQTLGGGLPRRALVMVVGPPGSGKTTLAAQVAFAMARAGNSALILTALAEPSHKLIEHLRGFRFFDEGVVGERLHVLSLQPFLAEGLERVGDEIVAAARQHRPALVILDGFRGLRGAASTPQETRQFLYDIGGQLALLGATVMVTTEAEPRDAALYPEAATADVVLGLTFALNGVRHRRALEVIKARGAAPLPGQHSLALGAAGIAVYPRLEARVAIDTPEEVEATTRETTDEALAADRARLDLPELDAVLGGGLMRETHTLVAGRLGTGKTLLGLHFALAGVRAGEPTLYLGFRETGRQLAQKADLFGLAAELRAGLAPGGGLTVLRLPPVELDPDLLAARLLDALDRTGARRLVVDSIAEIERAVVGSDPRRLPDYFSALVETLRARGITSLFTRELRQVPTTAIDFTDDALTMLTENMLLLRQIAYTGRLHRVLAVLKMSFSDYDATLREFIIDPATGIRVLTPDESEIDVRAGLARDADGGAEPTAP